MKIKKAPIIEVGGLLRYLILHELHAKKLCGDELAEAIAQRRSSTKLTPGTIYPTLKTLRESKLVTVHVKGRKKIYTPTAKGKKEYLHAKKTLKSTLKGALK